MLVFIASAWAHAFIDHAEPAVGSKLASPPGAVKIWFTERLEPALSKIQVFDSRGSEVDKRDTKVERANVRLLIVSLHVIKAGEYTVTRTAGAVGTPGTKGPSGLSVSP